MKNHLAFKLGFNRSNSNARPRIIL